MGNANSATPIILAMTAALCAPSASQAAQFAYTTIDIPGSSSFVLAAINGKDQIVGSAYINSAFQGLVWINGNVTTIPAIANLYGINDSGIAVGYPTSALQAYASYNVKTRKTTNVAIPFATMTDVTTAVAINAAGDVIGTVTANHGNGDSVAFLYNAGTTTQLLPAHQKTSYAAAINRQSDVLVYLGFSADDLKIYTNGTYKRVTVSGAAAIYPSFLTDRGVIGGYFTTASSPEPIGFLADHGKTTPFLPAGAKESFVTGVGPQGQVVGTYEDANGKVHGFVSTNGSYYAIDAPGSVVTAIGGISTSGSIFGGYNDAQQIQHGFVATCPKQDICTQ